MDIKLCNSLSDKRVCILKMLQNVFFCRFIKFVINEKYYTLIEDNAILYRAFKKIVDFISLIFLQTKQNNAEKLKPYQYCNDS